MKNITIIGGGACGTAVFIELLLQLTTAELINETKINLIEKEEHLGQGLAFGTDQPGHLLNTQTDLMGIHADEPEHFAEWLKRHGGKSREDVKGSGDTGHTYTTRKLYGDYVSEQAKFYVEKAKENGFQVEIINAEATDIQRTSASYEVICDNGNRIPSDFVILAVGTPKPNNYKELEDYAQYIDFPWPSRRIIDKVDVDDHVGILGSSLSAIDAIMTLVDNGHKGKISLFSPDGMLPRVQPEENASYKRRFLTRSAIHKVKRESLRKLSVKKLFKLFQQEVEDYYHKPIDWKGINRTGKPAEKYLKWDISCAEKGGDGIMKIIYSLRYEAGDIWRTLTVEEKQLFKRWLGSHWMINRHAMPLINAYRLRSLFKESKLRVYSGLKEVDFNENEKSFFLSLEDSQNLAVDKLINSTGSSSHVEAMECTLLNNLLKKEYLSTYPVGGALINELTMQTISSQGGDGIYALGHLVNGMKLDVNAVWFNVRTAATLSQDIITKIRNGRIF